MCKSFVGEMRVLDQVVNLIIIKIQIIRYSNHKAFIPYTVVVRELSLLLE